MLTWRLISGLESESDRAVFDQLFVLYEASFPEDSERESRETLERALAAPDQDYRLEFFATVDHDVVVGGVAFEYYPQSACGLITFVFVGEAYRGDGIARGLLERAVARLRETSAGSIRYVFAEAEDPDAVTTLQIKTAIDPAVRMRILHRLGARVIPISYVQPALGPGKQPATHLRLLLLFPPAVESVSYGALRSFLEEFYTLLIDDSDQVARLLEQTLPSPAEASIRLLPIM